MQQQILWSLELRIAIIPDMMDKRNHTAGVGTTPVIASTLQSEPQQLSKWISEATIIAATPVAAYFLTFAYHAGRAHFFGIPKELVSIDLKTFVLASGSLVVIAGMFVVLSFFFLGFWPHEKRDSVLYRRIKALFPSLFLALMVIITSGVSHWHNWLWALAPLPILILALFVIPISFNKDKTKSVADRLEEHERAQRHDTVLDYYLRRGIGVLLITIVWGVITTISAYDLGESEAERQVEFFVCSTSPETVVLSIYGDYAITARFNRDKRTVEKGIMIVKVTEMPTVMMHAERVGPLQPEK